MTDEHAAVIVGGGQAGLAASRELTAAGVDHVVIERARVGQAWRERWDSFCLVTPNWSVQLPGGAYDGPDPDGFERRDEVVARLERYAAACRAPVHEGVEARALRPRAGDGFRLETSAGPLSAAHVVLATGAYQEPHHPPAWRSLPEDLLQLTAEDYRHPEALPPGPVLVAGSGQTGCQIAEELHRAGRDVFLSCGKAPWAPRRIGGRDLVWWLHESGFLDAPAGSLPDPAARLAGNVLTTGRGGGRDLHLRTLRALGVTLLGRFLGADGRRARFAPDLGATVAWADERHAQLAALFTKLAAERGLAPPDMPAPEPFDPEAPEEIDLAGFGAAILAGGYRPAYAGWVHCPGAFDRFGFPVQRDGTSTVVDGLHFVGVHFLRKRKSSLLIGVGEDAACVARAIAGRP